MSTLRNYDSLHLHEHLHDLATTTARDLCQKTGMDMTWTRREVLAWAAAMAAGFVSESAQAGSQGGQPGRHAERLRELEKQSGGRLGVAVLDTANGQRFGQRADERFPMCSTFKLLAVAAVLARVDRGEERLERRVAFGPSDLLEYAPVTRAHVAEGGLTLAQLCEAVMVVSDNTAANLLLVSLGGPAGLTKYVRTLGDSRTRLDRNEPLLNEALPGDERDTTTPHAMLGNLERLLLGSALSKPALSKVGQERLAQWMSASTTGLDRLRKGVPPGWRVGDKTGSGNHGTSNDIAILWPPTGKPLLIAVYLTATSAAADVRNDVFVELARLVTARK
jgi:beta-lactamase class A